MPIKIPSCRSIPARSATIARSASGFRTRWFSRIDGLVARTRIGETDVQAHGPDLRGLPARRCNIDQRPGRRPRLAEVSDLGDVFAGRAVLHLRRSTREYP